ncbi:MAG: SDR family NAD(P)-dependent oxidoreductase [Asgard group archaeon]|nr:SDR family NAD(P)-dependent oxidoreductase [Asgard group archaeon]
MISKSSTFINQYGPWALIAGASEGLGEAFAEELAKKGLNLVLIARREKLLQKISKNIQKKYRVEVIVLPLDLNSSDMLEVIESRTKDLDVGLFVYNAALSPIGLFTNHSLETHLKVINLNCIGSMTLTYHFCSKMKEKSRGGIILMSSMAGLQGSPIHAHYGATRAYTRHLAESLWLEMKDFNVHVTACVAGATATPNYLSSEPIDKDLIKPKPMKPERVVDFALKGLVKNKPRVIPGFANKISVRFLHSFLSSKERIKLMGSVAQKMYGENKNHINK